MRTHKMYVARTGLWSASLALVALVVSLAASDPARQQSSPVPRRIISLVPAVTEMLFAMGDGASVIGVSSYDHYPAEVEKRPKLGALVDPDVERMLALRPDLVIVYGTQSDLVAQLTRAHVPMFLYEHAGLAGITTTVRRLGARVGHGIEAEALATSIEKSLNDIRAKVAGKPRPKTLVVIGREQGALRGIYASAGIGFLHDMLDIAGGDDVLGDIKRQSIQASTEVILTRPPDVIIELVVNNWDDARKKRELDAWRALPSLPAVRTNRLFMFTEEMMVIPGPRVVDVALILAKALHPEIGR